MTELHVRGDQYHSLGYPKRDLGERTVLEIIHLERTLEIERWELVRKEKAITNVFTAEGNWGSILIDSFKFNFWFCFILFFEEKRPD